VRLLRTQLRKWISSIEYLHPLFQLLIHPQAILFDENNQFPFDQQYLAKIADRNQLVEVYITKLRRWDQLEKVEQRKCAFQEVRRAMKEVLEAPKAARNQEMMPQSSFGAEVQPIIVVPLHYQIHMFKYNT
jgi:hypothetical protein